MLLRFPHAALPRQRVEQHPVHLHIARRQLPPLFEVVERFVIGDRLRQALEQLGVQAAEVVTPRHEPRTEVRAALEFEPLQDIRH